LIALAFFQASEVHAQATRTWVSGTGDDVNPCSRTAPCKTFAGAISKTATNGEISVMDPGGFGAVTITKSISIVARGAEGGILAAGTNGIIINAAGAKVNLEGLVLEGANSGLNGVRVLAASEVVLQNMIIRGFRSGTGIGVDVAPTSGSTRVFVSDTLISANTAGILVKASGATSAKVILDNVSIFGNTNAGVQADGGQAEAILLGSVITNNGTGVSTLNGGLLTTFNNNMLFRNGVDGVPNNGAVLK
jgi:Right handed beta helix region